MTGAVAVRRVAAVVTVAVALVASFGGGAGTYALLTDSTDADTETITLVKTNDAVVEFKSNCGQVEVTVADTSSYQFTVYTAAGDSKVFDETNTDSAGNDVIKVKTNGDEFDQGTTLDSVRKDGTTYVC